MSRHGQYAFLIGGSLRARAGSHGVIMDIYSAAFPASSFVERDIKIEVEIDAVIVYEKIVHFKEQPFDTAPGKVHLRERVNLPFRAPLETGRTVFVRLQAQAPAPAPATGPELIVVMELEEDTPSE